jgi:hypothetical protein
MVDSSAVSILERVSGIRNERKHASKNDGLVVGGSGGTDGSKGAPGEDHGGGRERRGDQQLLEGQADHRILQLHPLELDRRPHACFGTAEVSQTTG